VSPMCPSTEHAVTSPMRGTARCCFFPRRRLCGGLGRSSLARMPDNIRLDPSTQDGVCWLRAAALLGRPRYGDPTQGRRYPRWETHPESFQLTPRRGTDLRQTFPKPRALGGPRCGDPEATRDPGRAQRRERKFREWGAGRCDPKRVQSSVFPHAAKTCPPSRWWTAGSSKMADTCADGR